MHQKDRNTPISPPYLKPVNKTPNWTPTVFSLQNTWLEPHQVSDQINNMEVPKCSHTAQVHITEDHHPTTEDLHHIILLLIIEDPPRMFLMGTHLKAFHLKLLLQTDILDIKLVLRAQLDILYLPQNRSKVIQCNIHLMEFHPLIPTMGPDRRWGHLVLAKHTISPRVQ